MWQEDQGLSVKVPPPTWSMQRSRSPASLITLATWLKIRLWLGRGGGGVRTRLWPQMGRFLFGMETRERAFFICGNLGEGNNKCPNSHNQDEVLFIVKVPHEICWVYVVFEHMIYCFIVQRLYCIFHWLKARGYENYTMVCESQSTYEYIHTGSFFKIAMLAY